MRCVECRNRAGRRSATLRAAIGVGPVGEVTCVHAGQTLIVAPNDVKRALLAEILASSLAVRLTRGPGAARKHLESRIAGVGAFEAFKARHQSGDSRVTWPILRPAEASRLP